MGAGLRHAQRRQSRAGADTPPTSPPFGFADSIAGICAAFGAAMALYRRERTGHGEVVDVALYEPLLFILGDAILRFSAGGDVTTRQGNSSGAASPRGIYQAADGRWLALAASNQTIAMRLFDATGSPELKADPRYGTNAARLRNDATLQQVVRDWIGSTPRDQVLSILEQYEVVAAPVNDASDIVADPHFAERTLAHVSGGHLDGVVMPGPVLHLGGDPGPAYEGVPAVGEHTDEVLAELLG